MADAEAPQEEKPQDVEEKPKEKKTIGKPLIFVLSVGFVTCRVGPRGLAINGDRFFVKMLPVWEITGKVRIFIDVFVV